MKIIFSFYKRPIHFVKGEKYFTFHTNQYIIPVKNNIFATSAANRLQSDHRATIIMYKFNFINNNNNIIYIKIFKAVTAAYEDSIGREICEEFVLLSDMWADIFFRSQVLEERQ